MPMGPDGSVSTVDDPPTINAADTKPTTMSVMAPICIQGARARSALAPDDASRRRNERLQRTTTRLGPDANLAYTVRKATRPRRSKARTDSTVVPSAPAISWYDQPFR